MGSVMNVRYALLSAGIMCLTALVPAAAQDSTRYYVGANPGRIFSPGVAMNGISNDRPSICDEFINPLFSLIPGCDASVRGVGDDWMVPYDGASGYEASVVVGYQLHRMFRVEAEYYTRTSEYGQRSDVLTAQGVDQSMLNEEIAQAREWLGTVSSQGLMANVYFDVENLSNRVTPFLGLGFGVSRIRADYGSVRVLISDPNAIVTGRDQSNADEIANNLASTTSSGYDTIGDTQASVQMLLGVEIPVRKSLSANFRARWMIVSDFEGTIVWDPLRSHIPNLRRDSSEPVAGTMSTNDFTYLGLSVGLHHHF